MIKYIVSWDVFHEVVVEANSKDEAIARVSRGDYDETKETQELDSGVSAEPLE